MLEPRHYPSIAARFNDLGIPTTKIAEKLELSTIQADKKLKGEAEFRLTEIRIIADWLGCTIDDLVGRSSNENPQSHRP